MELITEVGVEDYIATRLRSVRRSSVKKELGSLRRFVTWAVKRGELASFQFPKLPKQAKGTRQLNRPLIELSARRALADPHSSDRELTLATWILRGLAR